MPLYEERDIEATPRVAARVLVIDSAGCVLLFRGFDPSRPDVGSWWFTPGGGVDAGETLEETARRELLEETGLEVELVGAPLFERRTMFDFEEHRYDQTEHFFCIHTDRFAVTSGGWTDLEQRSVLEHRWWSPEELAETDETVYPDELCNWLAAVVAT